MNYIEIDITKEKLEEVIEYCSSLVFREVSKLGVQGDLEGVTKATEVLTVLSVLQKSNVVGSDEELDENITPVTPVPLNVETHSYTSDFTHKRPDGYTLNGVRKPLSTWVNLIRSVSITLMLMDKSRFYSVVELLSGQRTPVVVKNKPKRAELYEVIERTPIYIRKGLSANDNVVGVVDILTYWDAAQPTNLQLLEGFSIDIKVREQTEDEELPEESPEEQSKELPEEQSKELETGVQWGLMTNQVIGRYYTIQESIPAGTKPRVLKVANKEYALTKWGHLLVVLCEALSKWYRPNEFTAKVALNKSLFYPHIVVKQDAEKIGLSTYIHQEDTNLYCKESISTRNALRGVRQIVKALNTDPNLIQIMVELEE